MGLFRLTMTYGLAAARAFSVGGAPFGAPNALAFRGGQIGRSTSTMMSAATMPQIEMTSASVMPSTSSAEEVGSNRSGAAHICALPTPIVSPSRALASALSLALSVPSCAVRSGRAICWWCHSGR